MTSKCKGISPCRVVAVLVAALFAVSLLVALPGCRDSQTIKNVIYDQSSQNVDQDSGKTTKVVSEEGTATSKDTGLYKQAEGDDKHLEANLTYTSEEADSSLPVPKFEYDVTSTSNSEASEKVKNSAQSKSQDEDATGSADVKKNESDEGDAEKNKGNKSSKGNSKGTSQRKGNKGSGKGGPGDGDDGAEARVYNTTGDDAEIPDVSSVAAYGQLGVIVQMLSGESADGGSTRLKATDRSLGKSAFSTVFADEGASSINTKAWTKKGAGYKPNVDEIISASPDTVLVTSTSEFTKKQRSRLSANDISLTVVPSLTSATRICAAVNIIGQMLSEASGGESATRAQEYIQYHDDLVAEVEGKRGYAKYDTVFDADMKSRPTSFSARYFTLVIDNWDYSASYTFRNSITASGSGVGLATVGYRWSPVSYYLGVGGIVNNAAAIDESKGSDGLYAPAWQFNPRVLSPNDIVFSNDFAGNVYDSWPNGFAKTTLTKVNSSKNSLSTNGFGTDTFPRAIVADKKMKRAFKKSASSSKGLYCAYGDVKTTTGTIHGIMVGNTEVLTAIASGTDPEKCVLVNPHGLFSSWIEGSVESVLESAWIASEPVFDNDWSGSLDDEIEDFYQRFYRYSISSAEISQIEAGVDNIYEEEG